jgi:hypothetical protein
VGTGRRLLAGASIAATVLTTAATGATTATGAGTGPVGARSTSAEAVPLITAVSVSPDRVAVRGLDLVPVTVTVTFADTRYGDPDDVRLARTTEGAWDRSAPREILADLRRTGGSGAAGTFTATVRVPSSADGSWRVADVVWEGGPGGLGADPRSSGVADATLVVTGTHRPRIRFSVSPQPLPYPRTRATVRAVASFGDTGARIRGLDVGFGLDNSCGERVGPDTTARTDRHGVVTREISVPGLYSACAWAPFPGSSRFDSFPGWAVAGGPVRLGTVTSATPSRTSARRGSPVPVTGKAVAIVLPTTSFGGSPVSLQRRVAGHWRTVGTGDVRENGRFSLTAYPPRGRSLYRVRLQDGFWFASSASRTFTITGT